MARVTVEECLQFVENRFELVLVAAKRAHQLSSGGYRTTLDIGKDKPTVVALREIEAGLINASILNEPYNIDNIEQEQQNLTNMGKVKEKLSLSDL